MYEPVAASRADGAATGKRRNTERCGDVSHAPNDVTVMKKQNHCAGDYLPEHEEK